MGRSTPSWIKRGVLSSHATALHATVLHVTVLHVTILHAIAAPGRRQCAQTGDGAVKAHRSALRAQEAPICLRLIGSCERCVRASRALDSVLRRST